MINIQLYQRLNEQNIMIKKIYSNIDFFNIKMSEKEILKLTF